MKKENGILVVEASLSLFFFTFFMLLIWSFSGLFAAQNAVSHAALQTVQSVAVDNMGKVIMYEGNTSHEDLFEILDIADSLLSKLSGNKLTGIGDYFLPFNEISGKEKQLESLFYYYLGGEKSEEVAKDLGIVPDSLKIVLDNQSLEAGVVKITVHYDVRLQFAFFGVDNISMTKHAMCRLFGYSN